MTATVAERRRAAGEDPFRDGEAYQNIAWSILYDVIHWRVDLTVSHVDRFRAGEFACVMIAAQLRALVLQQLLVTFSPPWREEAT